MKEKILILSSGTGGGHNSAAKALEAAFRKAGVSCDMEDYFGILGANAERRAKNIYVGTVTKGPDLFGYAYHLGGQVAKLPMKSPIYFANAWMGRRLFSFIRKHAYTCVVCTHLFPAEAMTYINRHVREVIPFYYVSTDYACIPFVNEIEADRFFLPHEVSELLCREEKKMDLSRISITGMPVDERFERPAARTKAREALGFHAGDDIFLIMTGSMGFGHVSGLVRGLLEGYRPEPRTVTELGKWKKNRDRMAKKVRVVVLGGENGTLKAGLRKSFQNDSRVRVVDFTTEVAAYMDAADVLFSKPGGLSSSEAVAKRIPLIHTAPIPGCETINAAVFEVLGVSIRGGSDSDCAKKGLELIRNPIRMQQMRRKQAAEFPHGAANRIVREILRGI